MGQYNRLPVSARARVQRVIDKHFGPGYTVNDRDEFDSPTSGMRYGYVVCEGRRVLVADCTPDQGDVVLDGFIVGSSGPLEIGSYEGAREEYLAIKNGED